MAAVVTQITLHPFLRYEALDIAYPHLCKSSRWYPKRKRWDSSYLLSRLSEHALVVPLWSLAGPALG